MTRRLLVAALLAVSCAAAGRAAQDKPRDERSVEEACRSAAQSHRSAEEALRKAKAEGAGPKIIERRAAEAERARRDYCSCLARSGGKSGEASSETQDEICRPASLLPVTSAEAPAAGPTPAPHGARPACDDEATSYERTWMHHSEDTKNKSLQRQLQSSKARLCGCLTKNYGYEGMLPQPLRAFCEDREILTPPYFPSRGEKPPTAAP